MVTWRDRWREWQAMDAFVREHEQEFVESGLMRAMTICQQRVWQDMMRLKKEDTDAGGQASDPGQAAQVLEVQARHGPGDGSCEGQPPGVGEGEQGG